MSTLIAIFTNPAVVTILVFTLAFAALNVAEKGRWD